MRRASRPSASAAPILASLLAFALAGCGDDGSGEPPTGRETSAGEAPAPAPAPSPAAPAATGCDAAGVVCTVLGMPGVSLNNGNDGKGLAFGLHFPTAVVVGDGTVYVADESNHRVVALDAGGDAKMVAGIGYVGDSVEGPLATSPLHAPTALAWIPAATPGAAGALLVALRGTNRVVRADFAAGTLSFVAGNGLRGYDGDGPADEHMLAAPRGVAVGADGTVYLADTENHLVRRVSPNGRLTTLAGKPETAGHTGDGGPAADALLHTPVGLAILGDDLYLADSGSHTIRRIGLKSGTISLVAGGVDQAGFADGAAADARFNYPTGLAALGSGAILVTEESNHCVRRIDVATGTVARYAGTCGTAGFGGDLGPKEEALLSSPMGVGASPEGDVYVADTANQVVREIHR